MQDRNWDRLFDHEDLAQERQARQEGRGPAPVRGGAALYQDRPAGHRERPWHPGDGPQGLRPGDLRPHVNEGYDHQEQYERAQGLGHGRGGYAGSQAGSGRQAWGSLGGGYGEQQIGQAGPRSWNVLGTRGTRPANRGPRGYRRTDERIHEDVCEVLAENDELDVSDVEVRVQDGEVTLTGTVESRHVRLLVEEIVESVRGVEQVMNQLRMQRAGGQRAA